MGKKQYVTAAEIDVLAIQCQDISAKAYDYDGRARLGYCEPVTEPAVTASAILQASRSLADLAAYILTKLQLDEQKRELDQRFRTGTP